MELVKMIILGIIMEMPIDELTKFNQFVDYAIKTRAENLLEDEVYEQVHEELDDSKVYFRNLTHPSELEVEGL